MWHCDTTGATPLPRAGRDKRKQFRVSPNNPWRGNIVGTERGSANSDKSKLVIALPNLEAFTLPTPWSFKAYHVGVGASATISA